MTLPVWPRVAALLSFFPEIKAYFARIEKGDATQSENVVVRPPCSVACQVVWFPHPVPCPPAPPQPCILISSLVPRAHLPRTEFYARWYCHENEGRLIATNKPFFPRLINQLITPFKQFWIAVGTWIAKVWSAIGSYRLIQIIGSRCTCGTGPVKQILHAPSAVKRRDRRCRARRSKGILCFMPRRMNSLIACFLPSFYPTLILHFVYTSPLRLITWTIASPPPLLSSFSRQNGRCWAGEWASGINEIGSCSCSHLFSRGQFLSPKKFPMWKKIYDVKENCRYEWKFPICIFGPIGQTRQAVRNRR